MTTTPPKVKYTINRDAEPIQVLRAQENEAPQLIATVEDGKITIVPGCERFESVVKRRLKDANISYGDMVVAAVETPVSEPDPVIASAHRVGDQKTGLEGIEDLDIRNAVAWLRKQNDMPMIVETPAPKPPKTGNQGDKNPAYVEHVLRYDPVGFAKKYGVLGMGVAVTKQMVPDAETRTLKKKMVETRGVITQRKTHLTLANDRNIKVEGN